MKQLLIALDQVANCLAGGYADETLSSHAYRMLRDRKPWGFMCDVIDALFIWEEGSHCYNSYMSEKQRMQLPPEFRSTHMPPA